MPPGYNDIGQKWKVRKTCRFCFKLIVFMKDYNFECFRRIGRVFSTFQKIIKSTRKMATPVRSGYSDFGQNWKVRKICGFCFKLIVFIKEYNFECFRRIGRVLSIFQKTPKSTKKMPTPDTAIFAKIEKSSKHAVFASNWLFSWKNKILNVSHELEGYFPNLKKPPNHQKKCHPDTTILAKSEKSAKHAVFASNWLFSWKNDNFECFRRIGRVF